MGRSGHMREIRQKFKLKVCCHNFVTRFEKFNFSQRLILTYYKNYFYPGDSLKVRVPKYVALKFTILTKLHLLLFFLLLFEAILILFTDNTTEKIHYLLLEFVNRLALLDYSGYRRDRDKTFELIYNNMLNMKST